MLGQPLFPGESGIDQLVEIIKVLGTPTREQIRTMNPNYMEHKFPQIKPHPFNKVCSQSRATPTRPTISDPRRYSAKRTTTQSLSLNSCLSTPRRSVFPPSRPWFTRSLTNSGTPTRGYRTRGTRAAQARICPRFSTSRTTVSILVSCGILKTRSNSSQNCPSLQSLTSNWSPNTRAQHSAPADWTSIRQASSH